VKEARLTRSINQVDPGNCADELHADLGALPAVGFLLRKIGFPAKTTSHYRHFPVCAGH
jgi:hypothetical protein